MTTDATTDDDLPVSLRTSTLDLFGVSLVVHHLSTGRRIIEADSMAQLFEAMSQPGMSGGIDIEGLKALLHGTTGDGATSADTRR